MIKYYNKNSYHPHYNYTSAYKYLHFMYPLLKGIMNKKNLDLISCRCIMIVVYIKYNVLIELPTKGNAVAVELLI